MKFVIIIFISLMLLSDVFAQSKQDYHWLFGRENPSLPLDVGYTIDFNEKPANPKFLKIGSTLNSQNAVISDVGGELLFYTNGCKVLNAEAEQMENGDSLNYDEYWEWFNINCDTGLSGSQGIMILNDPGNVDEYYIIHKPQIFKGFNIQRDKPLHYSKVDMTLDGGLGDVTEKNIPFYEEKICLQGFLTAINHSNGKNWWIVQPLISDSIFVTHLLTADGFEKFPDQNTYEYFDKAKSSASGTAKFSPDGTKYAIFTYYDNLHIYDFDRTTGILSNHKKIVVDNDIDVSRSVFGSVEWSSNSRFVYTAAQLELYQVDTWEEDIQENGVRLIDVWDGLQDPLSTTFFLMALAPDCRIYMCSTSGVNSYHVINHPDELGVDCDFVQHGIQLPETSFFGSMPNFPRFRVDEEEKCDPTIVSVFGDAVYYRRDLEVYPSPSSGRYTIEIPEGLISATLVVTDIYAQVLRQIDISGDTYRQSIDIQDLPNGIYNIEIYPINNKERIFYSKQVVKI